MFLPYKVSHERPQLLGKGACAEHNQESKPLATAQDKAGQRQSRRLDGSSFLAEGRSQERPKPLTKPEVN